MKKKIAAKSRLFVIDTHVLMHDPTALFRFQEHDIFLPMRVLEELDNNKTGHSEVARNARQASRFLDALVSGATREHIEAGIALELTRAGTPGIKTGVRPGRLFFQTRTLAGDVPDFLPGSHPDNAILDTTLGLQHVYPDNRRHSRLQGHQPAHQGCGAGYPRRRLLQRSGPRRCQSALQWLSGIACGFLGAPRQIHEYLEGGRTDLLPFARPRDRRMGAQ